MSRRASVDSPPPSCPHPALTAALGCMDVQLEKELARYRRRQAEEQNNARSSQQTPTDPYPQLSLVNPAIASPSSPPSRPSPEVTSIVPPELQTEQESDSSALASMTGAESLPLAPAAGQPGEALADPATTQLPPDDYLASSEQLLRNLDREQDRPEKAPSAADYLLTPLGIGAMLVLLIATTLLGAALMESERASQFGLSRFFKSQTTASKEGATKSNVSRTEAGASDTADEEVALDIDNLSKIQPSPNTPVGTSSANPNNVAPAAPVQPVPPPQLPAQGSASDLTRALIPPTATAPSSQARPSSEPSPSSTAAPPAATPQAEPSPGDPYYFVILPYAGPGSLQQAQAIVPDAYLRNFGGSTSIQMGALPTRQNAERFVEQLKQQGLSASVHRAQ